MEIQTQTPIGESLKTRFFVPSWWVSAFESAYQGEKSFRPFSKVLNAGLAPALSAAEAGLLPTLFNYLQRDFLENAKVGKVSFSPSMVEKEAGLFPGSRKKTLQKVFFGLGGMRVFREAANGYTAIPLFEGESWREDENHDIGLELGCREDAGELLTGFLDGYEECERVLQNRQPLSGIMGNRPPLMIWRPLWYELQGSEQMVLLNLEKAIQWQQLCLNLEGVFGESFGNLFAFERNLRGSQRWTLDKKISFLAKLTRKLSDHGSLKTLSGNEFMAFREHEPVMQLLWKVSPERIPGLEYSEFTSAVFKLFSSRRKGALLNSAWLCSLVPEKHRNSLQELQEVIPGLETLVEGFPLSRRYLIVDGNRMVCLLSLFLEWALRKRFPGNFPLLPEVSTGLLRELLPSPGSSGSTWCEGFQRFCESVAKNRHYFQELGEKPRCSIVVSYRDAPVSLDDVSGPTDLGSEPADAGAGRVKTAQEKKSLVSEDVSISMSVEEKPHQASKPESRKTMATDRIIKLQKTERGAYLSLIEEYLQSLDESARQLISDIRQRMQPDVFEQHMQHRLVRFMMQDFSRWVPSG